MSADRWSICPKCKKPNDDGFGTLREDWELGIDEEGIFEVRYTAHCKICGLSFEFEQARQIE